MLKFTQNKPHPLLRNYICGYWLLEAGAAPKTIELVPDGYPELFFSLVGSVQVLTGENGQVGSPRSGLIGQWSGRFTLEAAAFSKVLYVKLYPWTPFRLFNIPASYLTDATPDMEALTQKPDFRALYHRVGSTASFDHAVALLNDFFLQKLAVFADENLFIHHAVRQIYASNGAVSIDRLTERIHASRRYVEKIFTQQVGMSPKQYARIIRVKKASMLMLNPKFTGTLNEIAGSLHYYDQSHFLKDFKSVVQQTPTAFLRQQVDFSLEGVEAYLRQWDYS